MINNKINKDIEYKEEFLYPLNIHLNVTDACNLACKYCFVQHKPNYMNLDTAIKTVDWMYNNYNYHDKQKTLLVQIYGSTKRFNLTQIFRNSHELPIYINEKLMGINGNKGNNIKADVEEYKINILNGIIDIIINNILIKVKN